MKAESPQASWVVLAQRLRARLGRARDRVGVLLQRLLPSESQHLFALTIVVGIVCGLVAVAFHLSIRAAEGLFIDRAMHAEGDSWMVWTIVSPTVGGLIAGALLTWVVPGARGSGIPQVKAAFALEGGRIRFRDAFGKFWLATMQIGAGASLGREGPTVQICAGATSLLARATGLPAKSSRRLLPVGVAAGIAAAFNAPIAAVTFTIEEIVGSLDHAVLSGVVVAAALAAVIERQVLGVHPVIATPQAYGLDHSSSLVSYALLGVVGGLVSVAFTDSLLKLRAAFKKLNRLPAWAHPAVGGLVTGVLAVLVLKFLGTTGVTGGGYEMLGKALAGQLTLQVLVVLGLVKLCATVFSYSSGGAGGIFAPSLFIGSMLGGAVGYLDVAVFGHEERQLGAFALVGMGAVFAGVVRAPITSVLIIFEMTGGYGLVLPLMLANMTSYILSRRLRPTAIYEALLAQDGIVLPQTTPVTQHPLEKMSVADAMTSPVVTAALEATVGQLEGLLQGRSFSLLPVVDPKGALVGAVTLSKLRQASPETAVRALMESAESVLADVALSRAVVRMNGASRRQLVVLDALSGTQVVGVLSITDLVRVHARTADGSAQLARGLEDLTASELAQGTALISQNSSLKTIVDALVSSPSGAVMVTADDGSSIKGVVLLEHVRDFLRDDQLEGMLLAADLARNAPQVSRDANLGDMVKLLVEAEALVLPLEEGTPQGQVITRARVGALLVRWHARNE